MQFLAEYGLFLLKAFTLVFALLFLVAGLVAIASKDKSKTEGKVGFKKLNEDYQQLEQKLLALTSDKASIKHFKKQLKQQKKQTQQHKKRIFVLNFHGDIKASAVTGLEKEISAILMIAKPTDEVLVRLESGGGVVNGYGLGASQLARLRDKNIPLTIAVDKVAASGGYMMASVADKILAAPFAIIGSIGVLAQIPNFNRLLKKNHVEFEQVTAGEFKRTLTLFGENTDKAREKMKQDIEDIHGLFKDFVSNNRQQMDMDTVATGEYWLGTKAKELKLVDELQTSEDYLLSQWQTANLYQIHYKPKKNISQKLSHAAKAIVQNFKQEQNQIEDQLFF